MPQSEAPALLRALATSLTRHGGFGPVSSDDLIRLDRQGMSHTHFAIAPLGEGGVRAIARVPRRSEFGLSPDAVLAYQACAFARAAVSGLTPACLGVLQPEPDLPRGALIVEYVSGRPPNLAASSAADDLASCALTLATIHGLPVPDRPGRAPLHDPPNALAATREMVLSRAESLTDPVVPKESRLLLDRALDRIRHMDFAEPGPTRLILADTHPGNFVIDRRGRAIFVDLEKAGYGSPALDLAHATLPSSILWAYGPQANLSADSVAHFYQVYLSAIDPFLAEGLRSLLAPARCLVWLRTLTWMAAMAASVRGAQHAASAASGAAGMTEGELATAWSRIRALLSPDHISATLLRLGN